MPYDWLINAIVYRNVGNARMVRVTLMQQLNRVCLGRRSIFTWNKFAPLVSVGVVFRPVNSSGFCLARTREVSYPRPTPPGDD